MIQMYENVTVETIPLYTDQDFENKNWNLATGSDTGLSLQERDTSGRIQSSRTSFAI